ncbi:hypothetical protein N0V90_006989 [Kalmusia sp. IMI 367209]|nr:hypothetical protein N0V90_006989 [Kalmusia sp. IMI 367209]
MRFKIALSHILCYSNAILLPPPSGPYTTALVMTNLVDSFRTDPYDPSHGKRNVMISILYPVNKKDCTQMHTVPYMTPMTAAYFDATLVSFGVPKDNTFKSFQLSRKR